MCTVSKIVTTSFSKISCENRVYSESCAITWNTLYPDANDPASRSESEMCIPTSQHVSDKY